MDNTIPRSAIQEYAQYPFHSDTDYQQGLASILSNATLQHEGNTDTYEAILRRTRVFYFNQKTGHQITEAEARDYEASIRPPASITTPTSSASTGTCTPGTTSVPMDESDLDSIPLLPAPHEPRILTFTELQELIESGKVDQIPNNRVIPDALNEEKPSESMAPMRRKPWEMVMESMTVEEAAG